MDVDFNSCLPIHKMRSYKPDEVFMSIGKAKPLRIMFNVPDEPGAWSFKKDEKVFLHNFKEFCRTKNIAVPESDSEILRWAHANKMHN